VKNRTYDLMISQILNFNGTCNEKLLEKLVPMD